MSIDRLIICVLCGTRTLPEYTETCSCGIDVCIECSNYDEASEEFDCCDKCKSKKEKTLDDEIDEALDLSKPFVPIHKILKKHRSAEKTTEIEGIHLTRVGVIVVVQVQIEGILYPVMTQILSDQNDKFDHFVIAKDIDDKVYRQNLELLKDSDEGDVLQGPILMSDEQVERLRGNRE